MVSPALSPNPCFVAFVRGQMLSCKVTLWLGRYILFGFFVELTLDFEFVGGFVDKGKYHESVVLDTFIRKKRGHGIKLSAWSYCPKLLLAIVSTHFLCVNGHDWIVFFVSIVSTKVMCSKTFFKLKFNSRKYIVLNENTHFHPSK